VSAKQYLVIIPVCSIINVTVFLWLGDSVKIHLQSQMVLLVFAGNHLELIPALHPLVSPPFDIFFFVIHLFDTVSVFP